MKLWEKQDQFTFMLYRLLGMAMKHGMNVVLGEVYRPPETAEIYAKKGIGVKNSKHCQKLAADLLLFDAAGNYLTATEEYRELGEYWEGIGGTWGGRFKRADGGHFEWKEPKA